MSWPLSQDYNEAIQSPARNFADAELRLGKPATNGLGIPMPFSGNFADVYQVLCPDGGRWAVKCFTREVPGLRERYQEISRHLRQAKLPFTVDFTYLEQGIRVAGKWWPVLKMQWVEGLMLNQYVVQHLDKAAKLEALAQVWSRLPKYLRSAAVGHCDLQHGNILLVPGPNANSLALKLIDYDGMWVPALAGTKSGEVGHSSYQHPQRIARGNYNLEVDRFPLLVIATALRALSVKGRELWEKYDDGDNLLFKESDLSAPTQSALFRELLGISDPLTHTLVGALLRASNGKLEETPPIEELMSEAKHAAAVTTRPVVAKAGVTDKNTGAPKNTLDFNDVAGASARRRARSSYGKPKWMWLAGSAAVLAIASIVVFSRSGGPKPKTPDGPDVAVYSPVNRDKEEDQRRLEMEIVAETKRLADAETKRLAEEESLRSKQPPLGMTFVRLEKGTFYMGGGGGKAGKKTEIEKNFEISIHAVTQEQWQAVMKDNPCSFSRDGEYKEKVKDIKDADLKQFPVENVSWNMAQEFIKKLNERERGSGWLYRLPTEAEWEYACRGGVTSEADCSFHFYLANPTNDLSSEQANFDGRAPAGNAPKEKYLQQPTKVGAYLPNKLGLYDMHGNVWQWCNDLYEPRASTRVIRGGSWDSLGSNCRAANRLGRAPSHRGINLGFRLARVRTGVSSDGRKEWRYIQDGKVGLLVNTAGNQWVETTITNVQIYFKEVERNGQYVELSDTGRKLGLRLYPNHGEIRLEQQNWKRWQVGGWMILRDAP